MKSIRIVIATMMLAFAPQLGATELTVANGAQLNFNVPMTGSSYAQETQMVYPASMLTAMNGQYISELRFYCSLAVSQWTNPITVKLGPAPTATFGSNTLMSTSGLTEVMVGNYQPVTGGYVFQLSQPYFYTGGDLLVDISYGSGNTSVSFGSHYGVTQSNASCYQTTSYSTYTSRQNFLPKLTFTYSNAACGRATGITAYNIGGSDATVSWHPAENSMGYYVTLDGTDYPLQSDTTIALSGLTSDMLYTMTVNSLCNSGDTMVSQTFSFRTLDTSTALWLPYSCDFENPESNGLPRWWQRTDSCTSLSEVRPNAAIAAGSYMHGGARVLKFGGCSPTGMMSAVLPASSRELHVSFWYMSTSYFQEPIEVGLVDSAGVFHLVQQYSTGSSDYSWHYADFFTDTVNIAGPVRLAFRYQDDDNCCIDDLTIERVAFCPRPVAVTVDSLTTTSATLHITPADNGATLMLYVDGVQRMTTTDTVVTVTGLTPAQHYTLSVYTLCPTGDTSQAFNMDFRTTCDSLLTLPWYESFDDITIGTMHPCLVTTERYPLGQWDQACPTVTGADSYSATHSGDAMLAVRWTDQELVYIATPVIATDPSALHVSFWYLPYGYINEGHLQAGFMNSPTDTASFTPVYSTAAIHSSGEFVWTHVDFHTDTLSIPLPATACFAIRVLTRVSTYIDDIEIESTYNCPQPHDACMKEMTATEAVLTWDVSNPFGEYEVLLDGVVVASQIYDTHYVFFGLEPQHSYTAAVRAVCPDGSRGNLYEVDFTTPCVSTTLPITEDFETMDYDTKLPSCWLAPIRSDASTYNIGYPQVQLNSTLAHSSLGLLIFRSINDEPALAQTPRFAYPSSGLYIRFWESHTQYSSTLTVGLMTDVADTSTFIPLLVLDASNSSYNWQEHEIYFDSMLNADTVCLAFYSTTGATIDIDDLYIAAIPSCHRPSNGAVAEVCYDSVTLAWSGNAAAYEVRYSVTADSTLAASATFYDTVAVLHGLSSTTTYYAWVRAVCGASDSSEWLPLGTFTTDCAPAPLPYTEDFDSYTTFGDIHCWRRASGWADSLAVPGYTLDYRSSSMWNPYSTLGTMRVPMYFTNEDDWLISPLVATADSATLSFDVMLTLGYSSNQPDAISNDSRFGVATSNDNGATWQVLADWGGTASSNLLTEMESIDWHVALPLTTAQGGDMRLAFFVHTLHGADDIMLHIDNIMVADMLDTTSHHGTDTTSHHGTDTTSQAITQSSIHAMALYPNPASGQVAVECNEPCNVAIIDIHGRLCGRWKVDGDGQPLVIDTSTLPQGTCFVQFTTQYGTVTKKLIVKN